VDRQLRAIVEDLRAVEQRLRLLQGSLPPGVWFQPPAAGRWSPADCVAHLNLTSSTALPLIQEGLRDAVNRGNRSASRYRRDVVGWLVWKLLAPSNGLRMRTIKGWVPASGESSDTVLDDFARLQSELIACVREADQLPIDRVTVRSPYDARLKCNLYATLTIIPRHQQRHVLQAERAAARVLGSELSPATV
jgi:hypothetical protein